jgi:hypothetical protein
MLQPDDFFQVAPLSDALDAPVREAFAVVLVDWDRDGSFDHEYSDLTEIVESVNVDRSYASSLPDGVNAIAGFASGGLDLTMSGATSNDVRALTLFDPYDGNSPLASYEVVGTPIKVLWRVRTAIGDVDLPGFFGNIRSYKIRKVSGVVQITGVDNYDLIGAEVSLPRWAAQTTSPRSDWYENAFGTALPISTQWAIDEVLRQTGRSRIREPRGDTYSYMSNIGSALPSIGEVANMYQLGYYVNSVLPGGYYYPDSTWRIPACARNTNLDVPVPVIYGTSLAVHSASTAVYVPSNATSEVEADIGCVLNTMIGQGFSSSTDTAIESRFYLEDTKWGESPFVSPTVYTDSIIFPGRLVLEVLFNGFVRVTVMEGASMSGYRTWVWTSTAALPAVTWTSPAVVYPTPNEVWLKVRFLNNQIIPEVRFNGTVQTLTATANPGNFGYRYQNISGGDVAGNGSGDATDTAAGQNGGKPRNGRTNMILTNLANKGGSVGHRSFGIEWFGGGAGVSYLTRPAFPMLDNGKPRVSFKRQTDRTYTPLGSLGYLYHLPEVNRANGWETLKNIVSAEQGLLWTDENGTLNFGDASWGQTPTIPDVTQQVITLDSLNEVEINPTDNNRRNNVILNGQFRGSTLGYAYEQQTGTEKYTPANTTVSNVLLPLKTDATMFNQRIAGETSVPPTSEANVEMRTGHVSTVNASSRAAATAGWQVSVAPAGTDFRNILGSWKSATTDQFIGAFNGANQGNFRVAGRLMTDAIALQGSARDTDSIARIGVRTLSIDTNEWLQSEYTANMVAGSLLSTLVKPAPQVNDLSVPADPRRQLWDIVRITADDPQASGSIFYAQIVSKTTRWSGDEYTDTLTLRVLGNPGEGAWNSGTWDSSTWTD